MKEIVLASGNRGKVEEFTHLLARHGLEVNLLSLREFPGIGSAPPEGDDYLENAVTKARWAVSKTGLASLADDSGLEVEFLNGAPGPFSARYAGPGSTDRGNLMRLVHEMEGVPMSGRAALFRCVLALADPSGGCVTAEGICEGRIAFEPEGDSGFGYDPLFFYEPFGKTFAQMTGEEKNRVSHRAVAISNLAAHLQNIGALG